MTGDERLDPLLELAERQLIELSADIEVQLTSKDGCRPVLAMLVMARADAAAALLALVHVSYSDPNKIAGFQNEVRRYDDLVTFTRRIVEAGIEADRAIAESDRLEIENLIRPARDRVLEPMED